MTWTDDCRAYCQQAKHLAEEVTWQERIQHVGWLKAESALLDAQGVALPHLRFHGEYAPKKNGGHVVRFGLMHIAGKVKTRIFQLEVYPPHVQSHADDAGVIFGTHIHYADTVRKVLTNLDYQSTHAWVRRFVRHARTFDSPPYRLQHPFETDLFRGL